jgi:hypothetical protein
MESWWWIAPGGVVFFVGVASMLFNLVLTIAGRRQLRLAFLGVRLRFIGIGLVSVGLGARFILEALSDGPNIGLLVLGGLVAGFGGLYFVAASDRIFKTYRPSERNSSAASSEPTDADPKR